MNLIAEGKTAKNQRDQRCGAAAGNWGAAEPTKERVHPGLTLHKVLNGNYESSPITEQGFGASK
jgi:hypothetical protein